MIWFTKRKQWKIGPELPIKFSRMCSTKLNSTSVLLAFIIENDKGNNYIGKLAIFDFNTKNWTDLPQIMVYSYWKECAMTSSFNKKAQQIASIVIKGIFICLIHPWPSLFQTPTEKYILEKNMFCSNDTGKSRGEKNF
jgi:hypothetical protein